MNEKVIFRIFRMPCCGHQLCWVNPRLPSHCPECGESVYMLLKTIPDLTLLSTEAWIRTTPAPDPHEFGRKGGMKTAERGPEYYRQIAAMRKTHGGGRPKKIPS